MSILSLNNVSKIYGRGTSQVTAVKAVNLEVQDGEKVLLVGPSGSGKTTLLLMIGCLLQPSEGQINLNGENINSLNTKSLTTVRLKSIGFVFQSFNLLPLMTAEENVQLPALLLGLSKKSSKAKANDLLIRLGLAKRTKYLPKDLSGGEKQRVAVSRAMVNSPLLILADEPTANLDSQNGRQVIQLLCGDIQPGCGRSIIFASHDERIKPYVNRIITIEDGRIKEDQKQGSAIPPPIP
jgi:putative ABC transport system ATP-binding protein